VLNRHWDGSIVPGDLVGELIGDETIVETLDTLSSHLAACGIGTMIVIRPEIFSSDQARAYFKDRVPDLCGHIFIGPPHRLKYLKGVSNLACLTHIRSQAEAGQIRREFTYNPRRLRNVRGTLNGFAAATLLGDPKIIDRPLLLPRKTISLGAPAWSGEDRRSNDPVVAPLFLNNHDANNSAHVMVSRVRPLSQYFASRPGTLQGAPVFVAALAPDCDLPSGIAPAMRDLAYLALAGMEFTLIVLIEGAPSLTLEVLEAVAQRLNSSLRIAGFHPGLVDTDAIVLAGTPASSQFERLLSHSDYVLLFDFDWPESEINQLAILSGVKPMMLATTHPTLREMFLKTALVIPDETDHVRQYDTGDAAAPFDYPSTGSLRSLLAKSLVERLSPKSRTANMNHARSVFEEASTRLKHALGRSEP